MFIFKSLVQAVVGVVAGLLASCALYIVLGILMWNSSKANAIASGLAPYLILAAAGFGFIAPILEENRRQNEKEEALRKQREAEAAALQAKLLRERSQRDHRFTIVRQYGRDAAGAALELPTIIAEAELALDRADEEFDEGLYSPFWEAMEAATNRLHDFERRLHQIATLHDSYTIEAPALGGDAPGFTLGTDCLPDSNPTQDRLRLLYRRAQKDAGFAQIYEQRRTNAILISGFTSLGDAVQRLGSKIADSIDELRHDVVFRMSDLEAALQNAAECAQHQREELLDELRTSNECSKETLEQTRQDADKRRDYEQATRKMLDNIQRRRKPSPGDV